MTYRTEFPDYPPESMPAIPAGWIDTSWHNDTCPSFQVGENGPQVYVDYLNPARREIEGCPRFTVIVYDENDEQMPPLLETDDWSAVLQLLGA